MKDRIEATLREVARVHESLIKQAGLMEQAARSIAGALSAGGTLYVLGNGGSAADSQHMAGELVGRFLQPGRPPLRCQALTTDTSVLTAVSNDFGFDHVFVKQVEAFVRKGDVVLAISTSGRSRNVNLAVEEAAKRGAVTIALTGGDGGQLAAQCDLAIVVPATTSPRIQEGHATVIHILCDLVEHRLSAATESVPREARVDGP